MPRVIYIESMFDPGTRRDTTIRRRQKVRALAPKWDHPHIALLNGRGLTRKAWNYRLQPNDCLIFTDVRAIPMDGGGGGGSNPMAIVATIALNMIAPGIGEALLGTDFMASTLSAIGMTSQTFVAGASIAIGAAGAALISGMVSAPRPTSPNGGAQASYASASPTYNLAAQGNAARIGGAIPEQFGRVKSFPDFAAQPYVEYADNEQYLFQLLCLGRGWYDIESLGIEDTPFSSFADISYEIVNPGETLDLFPAAVHSSIEVSGQELLTGETIGPFVANASQTTATRIGFDVVCPRGLYYGNDAGGLDARSVSVTFSVRAIDDLGAPAGDWITLATETISGATTTPQRRSFSYSISPGGRFEAKAVRNDAKDTGSRAGHEVVWAGLRAYLVSEQTFGDVTLIGVKMRASNNLSAQASRKIYVLSTRMLRTWSPSGGWSSERVATRSIAFACAYLASACLPDKRIDLAALYQLEQIWLARGDTFNFRFDQFVSFWDAITTMAQAGRAKPYFQGGVLHFWRDQPQTLPVAGFSMRNIKRGSFSVEFLLPSDETADSVEITYFDETVWRPLPLLCSLPGSAAVKPVKRELLGVTNRDQAYKEGIYYAAVNLYRRTPIRLSSEMEGFLPGYGDLCAVSHDMMAWGQSGEVVAFDAGTLTLTLSEPLTWDSGTHYIGLVRRNGSMAGPYVVTAGTSAYKVVLSDITLAELEAEVTIYTGRTEELTRYMFGAGEAWRQPALVKSARPKSWNEVELEFWNEDPAVHTAELGQTPPAINYSQLPTTPTQPTVQGLIARSSPDDIDYMVLSWQPAPGGDQYLIEQSSGDGTWTRVRETSASSCECRALYKSATRLRVAAMGLTLGPWVEINYAGVADYMWVLGDDAQPMWTAGDDSEVMW